MQKTVLLIALLLSAPFIQAQKDTLTNPSDILDAFHRVELSMNKAGNTIDEKNKATLERLYEKISKNPTLLPYLNKATLVDETATEFVTYVEDLKQQVIKQSGGANDDIENHVDLLIKQGKGKELRDKINKALVTMLAYLTPEQQTLIKSDLLTEYNAYRFQSWESEMFEHSPAAAVVTILEKIKNDAKNTEAQILQQIENAVNGDCTIASAVVVAKSNFVLSGSKFEADIHRIVYDSCTPYRVIVNGQQVKTTNGITKYEAMTAGEGTQSINGHIEYNGWQLPFETSYTVYKGAATISADKMNVLYIGLDNPISVAVPGFSPEKVTVVMSGGTLAKTNSTSYTAKVSTRGEATISVSVKQDDGTTRAMGMAKFRIRKMPMPFVQMGTLQSGSSTESKDVIIANAIKLYAAHDEGFVFEGVKFTVKSFSMKIAKTNGTSSKEFESLKGTIPPEEQPGETPGATTTPVEEKPKPGDRITVEMLEEIKKLASGDKIIIDNVIVSGPGGEHKAMPFVITVK